jgi:hypothetical protein
MTILYFIRTQEDDNLQSEWNHIKEWCTLAQLYPNPNKTKVLDIVTSKKLQDLSTITDGGITIEIVKEAKLLGVIFQSDMKWDNHITSAVTKASKRLYSLIALRSLGTPGNLLVQYYCSVIRSVLLYAHPAWCNCGEGNFNKMEKVERRASKIIGLQIQPPLRSSATALCVNLVRDIADKHETHILADLFEKRENSKNTRLSQQLATKWCKTTRMKNSLTSYLSHLNS